MSTHDPLCDTKLRCSREKCKWSNMQ